MYEVLYTRCHDNSLLQATFSLSVRMCVNVIIQVIYIVLTLL